MTVWHGTWRGEVARLTVDAKRFRELAQGRREHIRYLQARPMGFRDPIELLGCRTRLAEYSLEAKKRESLAKKIRQDNTLPKPEWGA